MFWSGLTNKNQSRYDRLHKYVENRNEQEFVQDMGAESHQLVLEFFDSGAYDVIKACLGPPGGVGVYILPTFNHENQVGVDVHYRKTSSNDPHKIRVNLSAEDNVTKITTDDGQSVSGAHTSLWMCRGKLANRTVGEERCQKTDSY
jgi:hypothetical protein